MQQAPEKMAQAETVQFRDNLARLCAGHGDIQRMAVKVGITRVYLSKLIHGHATPSLDMAAKIASALGLSLDDLVSRPLPPRQIKTLAKAS